MPEKQAEKKSNTGLIAGIIAGVVAVVAIVVVVIIIIANGGKNLVGKWTLETVKSGETELSADLIKMAGMDSAYVEFKSDGTGVMNIGGSDTEFKYEGNKITVDGETTEVKVDGDKLTMEHDDSSMVFKKK